MARCSICSSARVGEVDILLGSGAPTRQVARLTGFPRTTLARHREHVQITGSRLALIRGEAGPLGPGDPLAEAFALAGRARTPRERLRALEAVRGATKLKLRGVSDPDPADRELLDRNIAQAEAAYRDSPDFETQARALSGWRESLHRRLDAVRVVGTISTPIQIAFAGQESESPPIAMSPDRYSAGVPRRFRDLDRYRVERTLRLAFGKTTADEEIKVYETATGAVVWVKDPEGAVPRWTI